MRVVVQPGQAGGPIVADQRAVAWLDVDRSGHGRGAYLHPSLHCLDLAERRRALARALRHPGGLDTDVLREQMAEQWPDSAGEHDG